jgi:hypothetical protein
MPTRDQTLAQLQQKLRSLEQARWSLNERISSGCAALDRLLPRGGFVPGTLVEWFAEERGQGAGTLAMIVSGQACRQRGALVVMDRAGQFYPPAAVAWGIDPTKLIVVRATSPQDELWALDQALRCRGVAAVWASLERLESRAFRRLQLAAEAGGSLGLLLRPVRARGRPSWADIQLLVESRCGPSSRRLRVELLRCRGQGSGKAVEGASVELEIDEQLEIDEYSGALKLAESRRHETRSLRLATSLAPSTTCRCSTRA